MAITQQFKATNRHDATGFFQRRKDAANSRTQMIIPGLPPLILYFFLVSPSISVHSKLTVNGRTSGNS